MSRIRIWTPEKQHKYTPISTAHVFKMSGHFHVQLINTKTNEIERELKFENCLTQGLIDYLCYGYGGLQEAFSALEVGTGGVTGVNSPNTGSTTLVNPIGIRTTFNEGILDASGSVLDSSSLDGPYIWYTLIRTFQNDESNGNLTELGFWSTDNSTLANRTAFKDLTGTPTTVSKTSSQMLRVAFQYRIYIPIKPVSGTVVLAGTPYNYVSEPFAVTSMLGWLSLFQDAWGKWALSGRALENQLLVNPTASWTNAGVQTTSAFTSSYIGGQNYLDCHITWNTASANFTTGIQGIRVGTQNPSYGDSYQWQYQFTPKLPKGHTTKLTLDFRWFLQVKNVP